MASNDGRINIYYIVNGINYKNQMATPKLYLHYGTKSMQLTGLKDDSNTGCYYILINESALASGDGLRVSIALYDSSLIINEIKWVLKDSSGTEHTEFMDSDSIYYVDYEPSDITRINIAPQITTQDIETTYTIYYYANGGSGAPGSQTKTEGDIIYLSSTQPTRSGYTFQGWESSNGDIYQPGDLYYDDSDLYLYAIWQKNSGGTSGTIYDTFPTTSGKYYLCVNGKRLTATKNGVTYYLYIQI